MTYQTESAALDTEILAVIERWHLAGESLDERSFNDLALRLFAYQLEYNEPYGRYCAQLGTTSAPRSWEQIPPVPAAAFKEAALTTFDPATAALVFETSGTTRGAPGRHYMETPEIYDAASLASFDRFMLRDGARLRYFNCVPNPVERPQSSLGYMMARVSQSRGDARTGWYLRGDELLLESFCSDVQAAVAQRQPVCLAATAFALVNLLDALDEARIRFALPQGSRLMETGGFKGRARIVDRDELYARIYEVFGLGLEAIVAEYGMTELSFAVLRRNAGAAQSRAAVAAHAGRRLAGIDALPGHHRRAGPRRSRQSLFVPCDRNRRSRHPNRRRTGARGPKWRGASTRLFARRRRVKSSAERRVLKAIAQSLAMEVGCVAFASCVFEAVAVEHRHASS